MDPKNKLSALGKNDRDIYLVDSTTIHRILRDKKCFSSLVLIKVELNTISRSMNIIEDSRRVTILLANRTELRIHNVLYSSKSRRNLFSFKDIRLNGYHIETLSENNAEFLCITFKVSC